MTSEVTCQELVELLSDYLDEQTSPSELQTVSAHLSDCPGCQTALDHLRASIELTRSAEVAALDPEVRRRLLDEFRAIKG